MADENANTSTEKSTSIDELKPKVTINPITGLPFGGGTINPETNQPDTNPITGQKFGLGLVNSEGKANYGSYNPDFPTLGGKGFSPSNIFTDTYTLYNQEPMEDYKKYGVPMGRHFDWDELRARNQSAGETVMNGIGKSLVTFGGALLENTIGFFAGLGEMATGGAYYDNAIGKTVDKWNNWAQEAMPIYLTEAEQNYSTWQKMGTSHFWADDVLGGMAYTAAAAASMYLTGGGGLLTKGAGAAATMAFGRTALWNTTKAVINGTKLSTDLAKGAALTSRLFTAAQVLEAGAMMSLAEASVEARETQRTTYDNLVQSYLEEHKTANIDNIPKEKLKEFEEVSYNAGNTNFVMQMPVLMGTNLLMFGRSVSGFNVGRTVNKDVIWNTATQSYVSKLADKGFMSATLSKLKPFAQQGLNEAFQESYQFGSSAFAVSYHTDKYTNNGNGDISKALAAGWDAMGTQEGIESALIGFITGGVMGGGRAITSGQYSNRVEQADRLAGLANGGTLHNAAAMYQDANAASAASVDMEMHLKNGNIKGYQDARFNLIAAQSMEFLERGGLEMYIDQLQESSTLSEAEFKKLYGYLETDKHGDPISIEKQSNGKNQHEIIDGIVEKIREFEKTYDNVNERFPLPERTTGLPRLLANKENLLAEDKIYNERANLRNELIFLAAGVKDRNRRMSNIQNKIQETADDIYMYNRDSRGQTISMSDVLDEQQPSHKGIKTWQEPGLKEKQDAFVDEQIGVDEQGNPIYAPGEKINPNVRLENQKIGAQPDRYNPNVQLIETQLKLKAVEDQIRQTDPLAADKIAELNKDYINLLTDNNGAIERYNQLSSDEFAQKQWTKALNAAIDQKIQQNLNDEAIKLASEAKTAKDISDNVNPGISPEAQDQVKERYEQLVKDEKAAYDKYYHQVATLPTSEDRLEALKDIDTENLTDSEKEGLRKAIATVTQQMKTEKLKNQSEDLKEEDTEVKETKKEIEEELSPENVGGVESISEDGRVFQIEGTQYYNRENNPTDAIIKDNNGEVVSIKLQNEQGDVQNIRGPQERIDALHYAILESEQYKVDSNQGIAQQDIVNRATVIIEENTKELKPTIKDAKKDSSSLRSEMYGLERSLDELLESQDQLRTSLIQDDSATKEDINANPTIKALKKQIKNTRAAITRRRNVLLNRNESVTPTITEITAVEQKSINDANELTRKIAELNKQILTAEETIERTEALMEQYQNDPGSFQQVSKENADAQDVINNSTEEIKQLYDLIEYKKQKLRRLENEKQNRPADPTKQTAPEDTGTTEKQITEGENPNTTTVPQEERITIAANLGYQRVNSNNYEFNPNTGSFTRIKNATDISIPGYSEVEAFTYKDQNGDTLVVDSLTGTVLGKHKNAKMAGKQAIETLDQGNLNDSTFISISTTETFKNIIYQNQEVSPAYEPTNTIEEQENFTSSEKITKKVITLEKGKIEIMDNTPAPGPGQRGGKIVMTQAEVEEHDRQVSKDLSEVISDTAQQEIDENKPYGNTQSVRSWVDAAIINKKAGAKVEGILTYKEGERQFQELVDLIDKRARMNQILLDKGKEAYSADKVIEEVMNKHNTSAILSQATIGQVAALHRYIKRKMSPTQPTTAAPADRIAAIESELSELNERFWAVDSFAAERKIEEAIKKLEAELAALKNKEVVDVEFEDDGRPVPTYAPVEQQIKKSEYEVHVTGDMLSGWDQQTYQFNVPGVKIGDIRKKAWDAGERVFDESIQNGKKVFTIVDGSIYRGSRQAGISASMVFNENTTHTLEDVKGNLNALMDSLIGVKEGSSFTNENVNFGWSKLDIKEIATPAVIQEESSREAKADPVEKTKMKPVVTKNARNNPETFKPWFIDTVSDSQDAKNIHKEVVKLVQIGRNLDAKNTTWKIGDLAANVDGRPMVSIDIVETGESFIMYKSKGEGTGIESKGQWVPIPGFAKNGWFVKDMWNGANPKFSKYNINEFQEIADFLSIPGVGDAIVPTTPSAEIKPKKVYESNLSIPLANDTKVTRDFKHIPVTKDGLPISYNPDMLNKEEIEIDKSVLLDPNIMEKQVEFELILNNWFMEQYPQGVDATNWNQAPIYVKIDGKYIGKLDSKKTEEAQVLVEKLQAGEKVTTKINKIKANNFNWAMTEDGAHLFYNPNEVMEQGQVILAFTDVLDDNPYWTTSEVAESKRQGDLAQINQDIQYYDRKSARTNYGQVGVIIRAKNNPENISRVSVGTTQFLTPKAIDVVLESLKEKNHAKAATIVANSLLRDGANSETFLEFDTLQDQTRTMIYRSPKLNKLVRINEHELAKILSNKTAKFGFVETYDNEGEIEYRTVKKDQIKNTDYQYIQDSFREDFKDFLTEKKYHVDRALGNTVGPYTSPVHGYKYNSYQEYLFAEREIGGERVEGLGHNSIFATDLVELNGSFFNNPLVEFGKGDLNGKTAETITNPVKPTGPIKPAKMTELERIARDMGLSEEDNTIPDCT